MKKARIEKMNKIELKNLEGELEGEFINTNPKYLDSKQKAEFIQPSKNLISKKKQISEIKTKKKKFKNLTFSPEIGRRFGKKIVRFKKFNSIENNLGSIPKKLRINQIRRHTLSRERSLDIKIPKEKLTIQPSTIKIKSKDEDVSSNYTGINMASSSYNCNTESSFNRESSQEKSKKKSSSKIGFSVDDLDSNYINHAYIEDEVLFDLNSPGDPKDRYKNKKASRIEIKQFMKTSTNPSYNNKKLDFKEMYLEEKEGLAMKDFKHDNSTFNSKISPQNFEQMSSKKDWKLNSAVDSFMDQTTSKKDILRGLSVENSIKEVEKKFEDL